MGKVWTVHKVLVQMPDLTGQTQYSSETINATRNDRVTNYNLIESPKTGIVGYQLKTKTFD